MLSFATSRATKPNPGLQPSRRRVPSATRSAYLNAETMLITAPGARRTEAVEDNVVWVKQQRTALRRQLSRADGDAVTRDPSYVLLVGGCDRDAFRLRLAQAHLRNDLWPSHWSHAALLGPVARTFGETRLYEIPLQPLDGFDPTLENNGLEPGSTLQRYADHVRFPNVCLLQINTAVSSWHEPPESGERPSAIEMFARQRGVVDGPELVLIWLAFLWGVGRTGNPLFDGHGIPSAVMIDAVLSSAGFDLSPGIDSRLSSPESFWQTAQWWHTYYTALQVRPVVGRYLVHNRIDGELLRQWNDQVDDGE